MTSSRSHIEHLANPGAPMPPLDGITVLDLTRILAGPFCTMLLGDMGAEVIKIEEPSSGDESRGWAPFTQEWSSYFLGVNRSKKSVALDLKSEAGVAALRSLVLRADVLVQNFRPGSLQQLGFSYDEVAQLNPRVIYCSISGYGATGPSADLPGYDVVIQGESGFMDVTGQPDGPPTRAGIAITDYLAGLYAMQGILLALYERERSGRGQHVDIALFDSLMSVLTLPAGILFSTGRAPTRMGNDHPSVAPYETLDAADGRIVVAVGNPRLWKRFCQAIGRPALETDSRFATNSERLANRAALKQEIEATFSRLTVDEIERRLRQHRVPCGRVRSIEEALANEQLRARDMIVDLRRDDLGTVRNIGNPIKLSRTPCAINRPPPRLGEHTDEVLRSLLTFKEQRQ
jgi:crotonobetainyl-CoA:carnitine CoA-transferase CaiB-like acyl-CoA transferase